jgi:hypothetical protein
MSESEDRLGGDAGDVARSVGACHLQDELRGLEKENAVGPVAGDRTIGLDQIQLLPVADPDPIDLCDT